MNTQFSPPHIYNIYIIVVVQSLSRVQLFATPWTAARQVSLSFTISQSLLKLMSIESVIPSNHLFFCHPLFLLLSIFPASGSFLMSQLFASGGQSIGASASAPVLPINIHDWLPLGLTGLISLQSKGLTSVFSNTTKASTVWCPAFSVIQLSHPYMTTGKTTAWSELPCPPPGIFLTQGSNLCLLCFLHWQAVSLPLGPPRKPLYVCMCIYVFILNRYLKIFSTVLAIREMQIKTTVK